MTNTKIATWNANGIRNKIGQLIHFINTNHIDIMLLNETKLKPTNKLKIRNYTTLRCDRPTDHAAGGVAAIIKNNIPHKQLREVQSSIEHLIIKLQNTTIVAAYNRPDNNFSEQDLENLLNTGRKTLLIGDLNAKHTQWNCNRNNTNGHTLVRYANNDPIQILHTDTPTHFPDNNNTPSTIDLVLNKQNRNLNQPISIAELDSDHNPVIVTLYDTGMKSDIKRTITSYKHTNWTAFRRTLDEKIKINNDIKNSEELDSETILLTKAIIETKKIHTRQITINTDAAPLPDNIKQLITAKNRARKRWQTTAMGQHQDEYKRLVENVRSQIRQYTNEKWNAKLQTLNPNDNTLWRMTRHLKKDYAALPAIEHNGHTHYTDKDKADVIAHSFERVHDLDLDNLSNEQTAIKNASRRYMDYKTKINLHNTQKLLTTPTELRYEIKKIPHNKAPGPDGIDNKIIKNLSQKAIVQLTYIINAAFKLKQFPTPWKQAKIIPIRKPNKDPKQPTSYRPISLLNGLSKLTERIILDRINKIDEKYKITIDEQFGFRPGHNTVQQITRIINDISINFNKNNVTSMTLLDIEKAFDKVWHDGLTYKMIRYKYPDTLTKLVRSFLDDRTFNVQVNNALSDTKRMKAGVPQGSVLSPKLFALYINDIPRTDRTCTALYADDTAIYAHSHHAEVANKQVQLHLNRILTYFDKWKIKLNETKTETILFRRKFTKVKIFTLLTINNHKINTTNSVKYLGMHLDQRLNFHKHVHETLKKTIYASKNLYSLLAKNSQLTQKNKRLIYLTLIRPIITYAAPAWCSASTTALRPLQTQQNRHLRLITNTDRFTRITELHHLTQIPTIPQYVHVISQKFYKTQLYNNNLTRNITRIREHNTPFRIKHKLPYQTLPIFREH
jgi:hypothetical protein